MRGEFVRPLDHGRPALRRPSQYRCVESEKLPSPPVPCRSLLCARGEPVLPKYGTHIAGRRLRKRIAPEKREHILVVLKQPLFGEWNKIVLPPVAQRRKPQVPVEARLIRRVDAGSLVQRLRLVAERIRCPVLAVIRTLEFDLVSASASSRRRAHTGWRCGDVRASRLAGWAAANRGRVSRSFPPSCRRRSTRA